MKDNKTKEEVSQFRLQECWPSFVGHMLPFAECLLVRSSI